VYANDSESALEGKFLTNTARVALILHVAHLIESGPLLSARMPIPGDTMESACKIAEWFTDESKRIYAMLAGGTEENTLTPDQQEVMRVLAKHQPATERDIKRHCTEIREKWEPGKLERVLIELLKSDHVAHHSDTGKGNRGTTWWKVKIPTHDSNDTAVNSAEHGKYGINGSGISGSVSENENSPLSDSPESIPSESASLGEESPVAGCPTCAHHRPGTYPGGLCGEYKVQQDKIGCRKYAPQKTADLPVVG
jgi:hypothetical protein